ncbi:MAG: phytanoyl-CoA dioxygenase family protein [Rhizobiaceae bacterium]
MNVAASTPSSRPASEQAIAAMLDAPPPRYEKVEAALSPEQFERFADLYAEIHRNAEDAVAGRRAAMHDLIVVPERGSTMICRTEYLHGSSPELAKMIDGIITPLIARFVGEPVCLFKDKCNEKSPGGGAFDPHQDIEAYRHFSGSNYFTAMVPLDPCTLENGCLQVATNMEAVIRADPSAVEQWLGIEPLLPAGKGGANNGVIDESVSSRLDWEAVPMARGDILIFDSVVPHYSEPNHSPHSRRALFLTYNRRSEGDNYAYYYKRKREDAGNPIFHVATPTDFDGAKEG